MPGSYDFRESLGEGYAIQSVMFAKAIQLANDSDGLKYRPGPFPFSKLDGVCVQVSGFFTKMRMRLRAFWCLLKSF